jgi:hypothetical protein
MLRKEISTQNGKGASRQSGSRRLVEHFRRLNERELLFANISVPHEYRKRDLIHRRSTMLENVLFAAHFNLSETGAE